MYYPQFNLPVLTGAAFIAVFATVFLFIFCGAVGGALLLAVENARALRSGDAKYRAYLKKRAHFFASTTIPASIAAGLGFWFACGLAAPVATQAMIRLFFPVWGIAFCCLFLEQTFAIAVASCWDNMAPRFSRVAAWIGAASSWFALVLFASAASFTLNSSGLIENWEETGSLSDAMLNAQWLPQVVLFSGVALIVGAGFFLLHVSCCEKDLNLRERVAKRMRLPALFGVVMTLAGGVGRRFFLPETGRFVLERSPEVEFCVLLWFLSTLAIFALYVVGIFFRAREVNAAQSVATLFWAFASVAALEFADVAVRNPYAVDRLVYANQLCRADVEETRRTGLLYGGYWTSRELDALQEEYPDLIISSFRYLGVATFRFDPPERAASSEESEGSEKAAEENGADSSDRSNDEVEENGGLERGADFLGSESREADSIGRYAQTVAQRRLADASSFQPIAVNGGASTSMEEERPSLASRGVGAATPSNGLQPQAIREVPATIPSVVPGSTGQSDDARNPQRSREPNRNFNGLQANAPPDNPEASARPSLASSSGRTPSAAPEASSAPKTPLGLSSPVDSGEKTDPNAEESERQVSRARPEELDREAYGTISRGNEDLLKVRRKDRLNLGGMLFASCCGDCHAAERGFAATSARVAGRTAEELKVFALRLNYEHFDMPPWMGTEVEAELLAEFLESVATDVPDDAFMKVSKKDKFGKTRDGDGTLGAENREEDAVSNAAPPTSDAS